MQGVPPCRRTCQRKYASLVQAWVKRGMCLASYGPNRIVGAFLAPTGRNVYLGLPRVNPGSLFSVISQSFSSSSFSVREGSLPGSNSVGWKRQSADGSLVPATRKTAENENDDDDEDDWEMTLNRDKAGRFTYYREKIRFPFSIRMSRTALSPWILFKLDRLLSIIGTTTNLY